MLKINRQIINIDESIFGINLFEILNIPPETIKKITVLPSSQSFENLRYLLKQVNYILDKNGIVSFHLLNNTTHGSYLRSVQQYLFEIQISIGDDIKLLKIKKKNNKVVLKFRKVKKTFNYNRDFESVTFGIITNGKKNINFIIESIRNLNIDRYEILICSEEKPIIDYERNVKYINFEPESDLRPEISKKKNIILKNSKYDDICILHDRYFFPENWYINLLKHKGYYEFMSFRNVGPNGGRVSDFNSWTPNISTKFRFDFILPAYKSFQKNWYIQGGIFMVNKNNLTLLNENLHWNELEDVHFSKIAELYGFYYTFDRYNFVYTQKNRLPETMNSENEFLRKIMFLKSIIKYCLTLAKNIISSKCS